MQFVCFVYIKVFFVCEYIFITRRVLAAIVPPAPTPKWTQPRNEAFSGKVPEAAAHLPAQLCRLNAEVVVRAPCGSRLSAFRYGISGLIY